jgi:hypothetical protein
MEKKIYILKIKGPGRQFSVHTSKPSLYHRYHSFCLGYEINAVSFYRFYEDLKEDKRYYQKIHRGSIEAFLAVTDQMYKF